MYPDYYYTKDHEWIKVEGDQGRVGITDFAQKQLGDIVFVECPAVGTKLAVHQKIGTIESVKAVSDVYCPVSGEVVAVNKALEDAPEVVNEDPLGDGWLLKVRASDPAELEQLLDSQAYADVVAAEEN